MADNDKSNAAKSMALYATLGREKPDQSTQRVLDKISRQLADDTFDVNRAVDSLERSVDSRIKDILAMNEVAAVRGEKPSGNPLEDNKITQFYLDSLKDIVSDMHHMTKEEMKTNLKRMDKLMGEVAGGDNIQERDFIQNQYAQAIEYLKTEQQRRSNLMTTSMEKLSQIGEQYMDVHSMFSGFVDNNPLAMGLFRIGSDMLRGYRQKKASEREALAEDKRRKAFAIWQEQQDRDEVEREAARREAVAQAQIEAAKDGYASLGSPEMQDAFQEGIMQGVGEAMKGFGFPEDEYSGTGDAPLSMNDLQSIMGVTEGSGAGLFERVQDDDSDEFEDERLEAMQMMRDSANALENTSREAGQASALEEATRANLERIAARKEEREEDAFEKEQVAYQDEHLEKMDELTDAVKGMTGKFEKMSKVAGAGGLFGGTDGFASEIAEGVVGAAGGGLLAKLAGKFAKPLKGIMKFTKPLATGAAGVLGAVGLGSAAGRLTESFAGTATKGLGKEAAEGVVKGTTKSGAIAAVTAAAKAPFEKISAGTKAGIDKAKNLLGKGGGANVAKGATKAATTSAAKTAGKTAAKSILKKIPGIGLLAGGAFAINRMLEGDFSGAGLELASGAASLIPGLGTAASIAIDAGLAARDFGAFDNKNQAESLKTGVKEGFEQVATQTPSVPTVVRGPEEKLKQLGGGAPAAVVGSTRQAVAYRPDKTPIYAGDGYSGDILTTRTGQLWTPENKATQLYARPIHNVISGARGATKKALDSASPKKRPSDVPWEKSVGGVQAAGPRSPGSFVQSPSTKVDVGTKELLEEIYEGEGTGHALAQQKGFASGYDVVLGHGKFGRPDKPLSQMTIGEVKQFQKKLVSASRGKLKGVDPRLGSSAVGRMQIINPTLKAQQKKLGLSDDTVFSPEVQDQIMMSLLEGRGYSKFREGKMSEEAFQRQIAQEWASIADPSTGLSAHNQHTGTTNAEIKAALRSAKTNRQLQQPDVAPQTMTTAKLESGIAAMKEKEKQQAPPAVVAAPPKQHAVANQTTDAGRTPSVATPSARNSDSTIQRLTDRWVSHSVA